MNLPHPGQVREGTVQELAYGGDGIVRLDRFVVFIPFAVPGDNITFKIVERKSSYARGAIEKIGNPSDSRVHPPCPIYFECGGCQLQQMDYEAALAEKSAILKKLLEHHLGFPEIPVEPPIPSPSPYYYRNKMQLAVQKNHEGKVLMGLYREKTHDVTDMSYCVIQGKANNLMLHAFRKGMEQTGWEPYDEKTHLGLIRHLIARTNPKGEAYAVVVATKDLQALPGMEKFLDCLLEGLPSLQGLALNINCQKTNVIFGEKTKIVWGKPYIEETIGSYIYRIGPTSFFQVNSFILPHLIQKVLEWSGSVSNENVLDVYSGVGTFSIPFAKRAKRVVAVEENGEAVLLGKENAEINGLSNIEFVQGKAEELLSMFEPLAFQLAFLDPPRKGLEEKAIESLIGLSPGKILYLSCNPPTLIRDLKQFLEKGWKLEKVLAVDIFPQTAHIEALALLKKSS